MKPRGQFIGPIGTQLREAVCRGLGAYGGSVFEVYKADLGSADAGIQAGVTAMRRRRVVLPKRAQPRRASQST